MAIVCKLREMITQRGLKQFEVAVSTRLSPTIIGNLYHNQFRRIDCKTAEKLCRYFNCELGDLFKIIEEEDLSPRSATQDGNVTE